MLTLACLCLQATSVHRFTVDTGTNSVRERAYLRSVAAEYDLHPGLVSGRGRGYKIDAPADFDVVTGYAYYIDSVTGKEHRFRYWRVPNEEAVHKFVASVAEKRGPKVVVKRQAGNFTITLPGQTGTRKWMDAYLQYGHGILAISGMASASIHSVSLKKVSEWADIGRGKHQMIAIAPQVLPEELRSALLAQIGLKAAVGLQQRDEESPTRYAVRRASGDASLRLVATAMEGIEELVAWSDWPIQEGEGSWRGAVRLKIKPKSLLSRISGDLSLASNVVAPQLSDPLGSCELYLKIPSELRDILAEISDGVPSLTGTTLATSLEKTVRSGRLEVIAAAESVKGSPSLFGAVRFAGSSFGPGDLGKLSDGFALVSAPARNRVSISFLKPNDALKGFNLDLGLHKPYLCGLFGRNEDYDSTAQRFSFDGPRTVRPLLKLAVNLKAVAEQPGDSVLASWFDLAEQWADEWAWHRANQRIVDGVPLNPELPPALAEKLRESAIGDMRRVSGLRKKLEGDFFSLIGHMPNDGSWRATAKLEANSHEIMLSATAGRALHRLYQARRMLSQQRIRLP